MTKDEHIVELMKENAELKEKNKELGDRLCNVAHNLLDSWCKGDDPCPHLKKRDEQLTKAKRYIKELARAVEHSYSVLSWQRPPIKAEAEQFLSEVEK